MPHISTYGGSYFSTKPNRNKLEADGFMKIGDIKGEVVSSERDDRSNRFTTGGGGDSIKGEATDQPHMNWIRAGGSGQKGYTEVEWTYVKDDVWTSDNATSIKPDALINYRPEGFSEVEIHFCTQLQENCANGAFLSEGQQGYTDVEPFKLFQGFDAGTISNQASELDRSSIKVYNGNKNDSSGNVQGEGWIIIES